MALTIAGLFAVVRIATTEPAPPDARSDLMRASARLHEVDTAAFDVHCRVIGGPGEPTTTEDERGEMLRCGAVRYTRMFGVERLAAAGLTLEADPDERTIVLAPPAQAAAEAGPEMIGGMLALCDTVRELGERDGRRGYLLRMNESISPEYATAEIWIDIADGMPTMFRLTGRAGQGSPDAAGAIEMRIARASIDRSRIARLCSPGRYVTDAAGAPAPAPEFAGWEVVDLRGR